eukprot:1059497-Rhodomonas_salina.1
MIGQHRCALSLARGLYTCPVMSTSHHYGHRVCTSALHTSALHMHGHRTHALICAPDQGSLRVPLRCDRGMRHARWNSHV